MKIATLAGALVATVLVAAPASAATVVTLHPGDFNTSLRDVRSAGHDAFLDDGLAVWTDDNSSQAKVAEYWDHNQEGLPGSVTMSWSGTQPQPGTQVVFDTDGTTGNGNDFNILVGEPVYGDDFWYTGGSAKAATQGITCPSTAGGSGSDCHGTLAQWQDAVPNAHVYAYGFSLGSGIQGAGVIHNVTVDSTEYRFSDASPAPTPMDVTGHSWITKRAKAHVFVVRAHLRTDPLLPGTVRGKRLHWVVKVDGSNVYNARAGADQSSNIKIKLRRYTGKHTVTVVKNGTTDSQRVIRTGGVRGIA